MSISGAHVNVPGPPISAGRRVSTRSGYVARGSPGHVGTGHGKECARERLQRLHPGRARARVLLAAGRGSGIFADSEDGNDGSGIVGVTRSRFGLLTGDGDYAAATSGATGSYVKVPYAANMDVGAQLSVEFWMQRYTASGGQPVSRYQLGNCWWLTYDSSGNWTAYVYDTNGAKRTLTGAVSMPLSSSYHVVLVYDATAGRFALYVNGVNITTRPRRPTRTWSPTRRRSTCSATPAVSPR